VHGLAARAIDCVSLLDTDPKRLEIVGGFVRRMAPRLRIELTSDPDAAIDGADFVVAQIRVGGQAARLEDERLGRDHGIIGQETTGVGGFCKALRTIPVLLDYAARIERRAPNAWLINFTNPVSIVTEALLNHGRKKTELGADPNQIAIDSVGLNHLSFIRGVRANDREVLPDLIRTNTEFPRDLLDSLGMIPSYYLRYFFLARETVEEQQRAAKLRAEEVMEVERELLAHYADPQNSERPDSLSKRGGAFYSHAALEIIDAISNDSSARLIVDTINSNCIAELPSDACIEAPCTVGATGPKPLSQRALEPAIRGLIQQVKAYEQLAIRAALSRSRRDVYLALIAHPLVPSANLASSLADSILARRDFYAVR
jgi:6-phospho-beta-glucosidase